MGNLPAPARCLSAPSQKKNKDFLVGVGGTKKHGIHRGLCVCECEGPGQVPLLPGMRFGGTGPCRGEWAGRARPGSPVPALIPPGRAGKGGSPRCSPGRGSGPSLGARDAWWRQGSVRARAAPHGPAALRPGGAAHTAGTSTGRSSARPGPAGSTFIQRVHRAWRRVPATCVLSSGIAGGMFRVFTPSRIAARLPFPALTSAAPVSVPGAPRTLLSPAHGGQTGQFCIRD